MHSIPDARRYPALTQMRIDTGRPVLMAHTEIIGERIYTGAGIHQTEIQY